MDRRIVEEKLESLQRCINRIEEKRPSGLTQLQNDLDLQDIISVNLERAVQLCVDIGANIISGTDEKAPATMAETFELLSELRLISEEIATGMKKAVGFRNIAVHNYQKINWEIVFNICHQKLDDFKAFAREINSQL